MTKPAISSALISVPARSSTIQSNGAATESGRVRQAEFQRTHGFLSSLKNAFSRLRAKMDTGRARTQVGQALQPCSAQKRAIATGNIRSESIASRATQQRNRQVTTTDSLLIQPEYEKSQNIARHAFVLTAMKETPASHFPGLAPHERTQVLNALDVCAGLSGETSQASKEGLLMLSECIDSLADSGRRTSGSGGGLYGELAIISEECRKRLKQFTEDTSAKVDPAFDELDLLLPDLEQDVARKASQTVATTQSDDLDQLVGELAKSMGPPGAPSPSQQLLDPALGEIDDLDQLAADIARSLKDTTDSQPSGARSGTMEGPPSPTDAPPPPPPRDAPPPPPPRDAPPPPPPRDAPPPPPPKFRPPPTDLPPPLPPGIGVK